MSDTGKWTYRRSPVERAARAMYELGLGYDIDGDPTARASALEAAERVLKASGTLTQDPVTKVVLDNCRRHYFEWTITPRWQVLQRRRRLELYVAAVDRLLLHVQDKVDAQESPGPRHPSLYEYAVGRWGEDPQQWPGWFCPNCGQRHCGWSLDCGRCETPRIVSCPSTHGGSGWMKGTRMLDDDNVICGVCGTIIRWTGWLPEWVKPR